MNTPKDTDFYTPESVNVGIFIVDDGIKPAIALPEYKTEHAAAVDLQARVTEKVIVFPGDTVKIPTGLVMAIPVGYEGQVRPRSGVTLKGIGVGFGTIDADYRGEVSVIVTNTTKQAFAVNRGDRIAQMVISPLPKVQFQQVPKVEDLGETKRGVGGFGSTGT